MSAQAIDSPTNSALAGRLGLERTLTLVARLREAGILLVLLAVVAIVTIQAPLFFSVSNFEQILLKPLPLVSRVPKAAEEHSLEAADRMLRREQVVANLGIIDRCVLGSR